MRRWLAPLGLVLLLQGPMAPLIRTVVGAAHTCVCHERVCRCAHARPAPSAPAMPGCHEEAATSSLRGCHPAQDETLSSVVFVWPAVAAMDTPALQGRATTLLAAALSPPEPGPAPPPPRLPHLRG